MPLLLVFAIFLIGFALQRNGMRVVQEIAISFDDESMPFITRETVNKLLIVSDEKTTGKAKENIALSVMESAVKEHPIVKNADVYMTPSGKIGVLIEQRKPIARIQGKTSFYIDENAETMPLSENFSARVPLVTGVSTGEIQEVSRLVNYIRQDGFLSKHIIGVERQYDGEYSLEARKLDYKIVLGSIEDLEKRFSNYKAFYQKALTDKSLDAYDRVILKFDGQVVCERRKERG